MPKTQAEKDEAKKLKETSNVESKAVTIDAAKSQEEDHVENPSLSKKSYTGHEVISETTRDVEGITFHHFRLDDGTEVDLLPREYNQLYN